MTLPMALPALVSVVNLVCSKFSGSTKKLSGAIAVNKAINTAEVTINTANSKNPSYKATNRRLKKPGLYIDGQN